VEDRISYFERMLADNPENPTGLLALANEYKKAGREEDEAAVLKRYVEAHEDEGNAYLRLGEVLTKLGRRTRHGKPTARASGRPRNSGTAGWPRTSGSRRFSSAGRSRGGRSGVRI